MSKEKKKIFDIKNIGIKKKIAIILSLIVILIIIFIAIYLLSQPKELATIRRDNSNIQVNTNIQNIEVINVSNENNLGQNNTEVIYILLNNIANDEQTVGDITIELIDSNGQNKGVINGYVPKIEANSNYEVKAITNIDLSDVSKINIIKNTKRD